MHRQYEEFVFQNEQGSGVKIRIIKHVGTYSCICPFVTC